jgi:hypothetical protein
MSVKIELPPEIEANLAAQTAAHGIPLPEYLRRLLEEKAAAGRSPEERANFWQDTAGGLPELKLLPDEAISRETIYSGRG